MDVLSDKHGCATPGSTETIMDTSSGAPEREDPVSSSVPSPATNSLKRFKEVLGVTSWLLFVPWSYFWAWPLFLFFLLNPATWWITLLYLVWIYIDRDAGEKGGRRMNLVYNMSIWHHARDYFPVTLERTAELDPSKNYLLCAYPHGIVPPGLYLAFGTNALDAHVKFPGMKMNTVVLDVNFYAPFVRELLLASGGVSSSERSITHLLRDPRGGRMVTLIVGGAAEAMYTRPDCYHIIIRKRTGFCRVALQEGAPLVPVFSFGENRVYNQVRQPWLRKVQDKVKKLTGIAPLVPFGRGLLQPYFGAMPHRVPIHVVVGEPIPVERVPNPTMEQILSLRQQFEHALVQLYEKYRPVYHPNEDIPLIIE